MILNISKTDISNISNISNLIFCLFIYSVVPRLERGSQRSIGSTAGRKTNDADVTLPITNGTDGGVDSSANQETRTSRTSRASRASSESIRNISTSVYTTEVENVFEIKIFNEKQNWAMTLS